MNPYDPDIAPDPEWWLAIDEQERISQVMIDHEDRFPDPLHAEGANEMMHGSLHAIVETQIASADPAVTGQTLERLCAGGLRRHAALHAIMRVLVEKIAALSDAPFDHEEWARELTALEPEQIVGSALHRLPAADDPPPQNRAQRRASKKKRRRS